jgi:hypothetical protein
MISNVSDLKLTQEQLGIQVAHNLNLDAAAHNIACFFEIQGPLDTAFMDAALRHVVDEVDALHLSLTETPDGPRRAFKRRTDWTLLSLDYSDVADGVAAARSWMRRDIAQPVDLLRDSLFVFALIRVGPERTFFYQRCHHIIIAGLSVGLIEIHLAEVYTAMAEGQAPSPRFFGPLPAVLEESRRYEDSSEHDADRKFWHQYLEGWSEPLHLIDREMPASARLIRTSIRLSAAKERVLGAIFGRSWPVAAADYKVLWALRFGNKEKFSAIKNVIQVGCIDIDGEEEKPTNPVLPFHYLVNLWILWPPPPEPAAAISPSTRSFSAVSLLTTNEAL